MSSKETKKDKSKRISKYDTERKNKERIAREGLVILLLYKLNYFV